jgi:hypothetical protein
MAGARNGFEGPPENEPELAVLFPSNALYLPNALVEVAKKCQLIA